MGINLLGLVALLRDLYGNIHIPSAVMSEVVIRGLASGSPDAWAAQQAVHQGYITVVAVGGNALPDDISSLPLDWGEKESLYIALRDSADLILFDETKARREAHRRGLNVKGTLGVITQAYRAGRLTLDDVEFVAREIAARGDIWIADELCRRVVEALKAEGRQGTS